MAVILAECPNCGRETEVTVGERFHGGELMWFKSYSCSICGYQESFDDEGPAPSHIRIAILAAEGTWGLSVPMPDREASRVLKALRSALDLSVVEISQLRQRLPGIVATGTRGEMERLHASLTAQEVNSTLELIK